MAGCGTMLCGVPCGVWYCLARGVSAIIRNPRFLLLDEATSALDSRRCAFVTWSHALPLPAYPLFSRPPAARRWQLVLSDGMGRAKRCAHTNTPGVV
jgi:hypothetical protein